MDHDQKRSAMAAIALPFLVDQAGGEVRISQEAYDDLLARYGGADKLALELRQEGTDLVLRLRSAPARPPVV